MNIQWLVDLFTACNKRFLAPQEDQKNSTPSQSSPSNANRMPGLVCLSPFYTMDVFYERVYTCCPDWTKYQIGDIRNQTIADIWNSDAARFIRRKIYAGEWEDVCNPCCARIANLRNGGKLISYDELENNSHLTPQLIEEIRAGKDYLKSSPTCFKIDNSSTCNINCIMCTRHAYPEDKELIAATSWKIENYLPYVKSVILSGSGDPFCIPYMRDWMMCDRYPNLRFDLITNGLLIADTWDKIKHRKFGSLLISIDAATRETYEQIRIDGKWQKLLAGLEVVSNNRNRFQCFPYVSTNMTVMRLNYREIPAFIDMAESYGFNASFQQIRGNFGDQNIFALEDDTALKELGHIVRTELARTRTVAVFWGDILDYADYDHECGPEGPSRLKALTF